MSCNGCRVLRKACAPNCTLRTSLQWIPVAEAQGNATLFLAKFFGRSDLLALIAAVPESQRPAMFRSLLFEACGRTVNPVNGAVGLLSTGNWKLCQDAVSTVLCGGTLQPLIPPVTPAPRGGGVDNNEETPIISAFNAGATPHYSNLVAASASPINSPPSRRRRGKRSHFTENWQLKPTSSTCSEMSSEMLTVDSSNGGGGTQEEMKLLNLFV